MTAVGTRLATHSLRSKIVRPMESILKGLIGKTIDVSCGRTAVLRGEVLEISDGVLFLKDEDDKKAYVAISQIATVCEVSNPHTRPGFVG